ncbi:LysE family translocator [Leminorella grimontii]|uniref:LysE family translocator n=1 Tax=Leminorella grimontii TaxID=82981 RepID=UPI0032202DC6
MINEWLPSAFLPLALAHGVALLSPGPDFFLLTGYAIRYRLRGSAFICLGIALGNAVYIAVAIVGFRSVAGAQGLFTLIQAAGALYLLYIGTQLLKSRPGELTLNTTSGGVSAFRQLALGLGSSLLNPKNALFYMSLMTSILGSQVTLTQQIGCGIWMFFAVLLWDLLVASAIGLPVVQERLGRWLHWIERGAGAVLVAMGLGLMVDIAIT